MQKITDISQISELENNKIIGAENLNLVESEIQFSGENNILFCEESVNLVKSVIMFNGSNSVVYLSGSKHQCRLNLSLYNNSVFYCGRDNYFNDRLNVVLSEQKHMFIGNGGLFSFGIWARTADPHLVYSAETKMRINPSKSVFLGDHVWIGQEAMLLKGAKIYSGSILGAQSVLAGKTVESNSSYAGNGAKRIAKDIFWDSPCVHAWTQRNTSQHRECDTEDYIFTPDDTTLTFDEIDKKFTELKTAEEKLEYLKSLSENPSKNRFAYVIVPKPEPKTFKHKLRMKLKAIILKIIK